MKCSNCGKLVSDDFKIYGYRILCDKCVEKYYYCGFCGNLISREKNPPTYFSGGTICPECNNNKIIICEVCGRSTPYHYKRICFSCLESNIFFCSSCGKGKNERSLIYWKGEYICEECLRMS